ncbi:MAG: DEAD/DEAH box helicase [Gammaproteobacteria bacterium]|nr:DEAD/DEAH box helicase [Gammaproteobacteria bacterium]
MNDFGFHPAVSAWFDQSFAGPTACQTRAWNALAHARHTLVAAPTGSGKTLAAFLTAIDSLVRQAVDGVLASGVQVVYVSPLKALSNDINRNLDVPLRGIEAELQAQGYSAVDIRTAVRTGDTPQALRALMRRRPPHILVTTPESLYILLTSDSGRDMLRTTRMVIVDEIHALAGNKRGAHLSLTLERLSALTAARPLRVGLSATQKPLDEIAKFLIGSATDATPAFEIVDEGHGRARDLAIELPSAPLEAVLSGDAAGENHERIAELIRAHRTTLVFVNTRRMAERVAKALSDRIGADAVCSHHGSMARELRLHAEQRLKSGELKALVATASLELGIDIGEVDLVCQIGTTRSLAGLLQRIGRSGHRLGAIAKGRLFPQTRDELVESAALLDMTRRGEIDAIEIAGPALDVLAQQIVAEAACRDYGIGELFDLVRGAYPYRALARREFETVLTMLADGYSFAHGKRGAHLHLDRINGVVRARPGARLVAVTCGGAIPDTADYQVLVEPSGHMVGTVNEDFAIESLPGDIFQLGNNSWRILKVDSAAVRVADAAGQPPNIPFWLGEAPARSAELSLAVSRLRAEFAERVDANSGDTRQPGIEAWLTDEIGIDREAAAQIYEYLLSGYRALTAMPTQETLILERFFDESGGMQLVIHSPFGARINRAWGLALRKRFCGQFNFELQAAAVEDAIVISLGAMHSFPLDDVWRFLNPNTVRDVLTQALLDAPMFTVRWRWVAACALAIMRYRAGRKTPPRLLRMQAEDLVGLVFPEQLACAENLHGPRQIPDHPLVQQAVADCLNEAMDIAGLERLLTAIAGGEKRLLARDLTEPSPFAQAVLNANPYAFLDDAPLEERRTQAVHSRRWLDSTTASDLGALNPAAIARVKSEVWPAPRSADELHEALSLLGVVNPQDLVSFGESGAAETLSQLRGYFAECALLSRVVELPLDNGLSTVWMAAENTPLMTVLWPSRAATVRIPEINADALHPVVSRADAIAIVVRGWLEVCGPITASVLSRKIDVSRAETEHALLTLESAGIVLRGHYLQGDDTESEWCDRRLLARIHRYTLNRLRAEIEPVAAACYLRFLFEWQYVAPTAQVEGLQATQQVLEQLAGFEAPAAAWEATILPLRVRDYSGDYLEQLTTSGRFAWLRLSPRQGTGRSAGPVKAMPLVILPRAMLPTWQRIGAGTDAQEALMSPNAVRVWRCLKTQRASFYDDIAFGTGLLKSQCESALGELVAEGWVTSDSFIGLRVLLTPSAKRRPLNGARRRRVSSASIEDTGRWDLIKVATPLAARGADHDAFIENLARTLLRRYGVIFRRVLERELCLGRWREILRCLRRLEARGEIRGGRFVDGFSGEQFALPEALELLRRLRAQPGSGVIVAISTADPLNLVGIVTPGVRIPATLGGRIAFQDGEPVGVQIGLDVRILKSLGAGSEMRIRTALSGVEANRRLQRYGPR